MSRAAIALGVLGALLLAWPAHAAAQLFRSPVTCSTCISDYYYVDQGGQDWNCGRSTYGGHTGSDYSLRNGNFAINDNNEVVAMAAGTVVKTEDGYYDRCTQCGGANCGTGIGNGFANQVVINHGAYRTIYGHMKMGSIAVAMGDTVTCGQVIGFMGSSGCSTGAHLHIEPSLAANFGVGRYTPLEPYAGTCSSADESMFVDQGAYRTLPSTSCDDGTPPAPTCPAETYPIWTCNEARDARRRCVDGMVTDESCEFGCTVMPAGVDDVCVLPPDADGDGSRADVDCDDSDAALHPGAVEVCGDGIDQECSGADMACPTPPTGGSGGTTPPAGGQGGGAGSGALAGQAAPPVAGQFAPPLGQAGAFGAAGTPGGFPLPAQNARKPAGGGCSAVSSPVAAGDGLWLAALLVGVGARIRRRARRR